MAETKQFQHESTTGPATQSTNGQPHHQGFEPNGKARAVETATAGQTSRSKPEEAIAVIGMAGQFPKAANVRIFWENLQAGIDGVSEVPSGRWADPEFFDPAQGKPGKSYSKWGGFLERPLHFDPLFFNISPQEAELMDPQQRLFLLESWRAMEDAGLADHRVDGLSCGVFAGCSAGDYLNVLQQAGREGVAHAFMGNAPSMLPSRIAYWLNLQGPVMAIDTACSSSLVAIHLACESLRRGEAQLALAGGVNVMCTPRFHISASQTGMLSPSGRCRTFDAGADGFVPGEAVAVLVLKRLSEALQDGDQVHGVIQASAVNQDGRSNGITAPNARSQVSLIRDTYQRFGIDPRSIGLVECHGTGTKLGDPIEFEALREVYAAAGAGARRCALGSVKSNIGHTLGAAGVAGVVKALLAVRHGLIPPSLHFERANEHIALDDSPFTLNTHLQNWPDGERRRVAVSSFGFSGTNAHLVVAEPPVKPASAAAPAVCWPILLSARDHDALWQAVADLQAWVRTAGSDQRLDDMAFTLCQGRSHHTHRLALLVADKTQLATVLEELIARGTTRELWISHGISEGKSQIASQGLGAAQDTPMVWSDTPLADHEDRREVLAVALKRFVGGALLDWSSLFQGRGTRRLSMPGHPLKVQPYHVALSGTEQQAQAERIAVQAEPQWASQVQNLSGTESPTLCYRPSWEAAPLPALHRPEQASWLCFVDEDQAGRLAANEGLIVVQPGTRFSMEPDGYRIRPGAADDYRKLFAAVEPDVVVHAWSANAAEEATQLELGIESIFWATKSLLAGGLARDIRFLFHHAAGQPMLEAVTSYLLTLAQEQPKFQVRSIAGEWSAVPWRREGQYADSARVIRYRAGERQRRLLRPVAFEEQKDGLSERGVYLIVGGLGAVGMVIARYLAERYRARLILNGRSPLDETGRAALETLRQRGAEVDYVAADVSQMADAERLLTFVDERHGQAHGVIHAAATFRNDFILKQQWPDFCEVLAPKVWGTRQLDRALGQRSLDFFMVCSSIAAVLPEPGQGSYAFANAYQDAWVRAREHRRQQGHCHGKTVAVNWQMWTQAGLLNGDVSARDRQLGETALRLTGLPPLSEEAGCALFKQALAGPGGTLLWCRGDQTILDTRIAAVWLGSNTRTSRLGVTDGTQDTERLRRQTLAYVRGHLSTLLRIPVSTFKEDRNFSEYGVDSILIGQFNALIEDELPDLPKTLLFEHPNLTALTDHLLLAHRAELEVLFAESQRVQPEATVATVPVP